MTVNIAVISTEYVALRFDCPTTKKPVVFHIKRDRETFQKRWPNDLRRICPHCRARHRFAFKEGVVSAATSLEELA
jgi:hypothetical protein